MPRLDVIGSICIYINSSGEHNPPHLYIDCGDDQANVAIEHFAFENALQAMRRHGLPFASA